MTRVEGTFAIEWRYRRDRSKGETTSSSTHRTMENFRLAAREIGSLDVQTRESANASCRMAPLTEVGVAVNPFLKE